MTTASRINYIWRVIATGLAFAFFGLGALFISYIIFPMIRIYSRSKPLQAKRIQYVVHLSFKFFCFFVQALGLIRFQFSGFEKLKSDQRVIFISNHPTLIDYVVIVSQLKQCNIIVKESLWDNPFTKGIVSSAGYVPNRRTDDFLTLVRKSMKEGNNVLVFPEGTRTVPGQSLVLQRGAAQMGLRLPACVRIIKIRASSTGGLTKGCKWYQIPDKPIQYHVSVGELINPQSFLDQSVHMSLAARQLTRYFKQQLGVENECLRN